MAMWRLMWLAGVALLALGIARDANPSAPPDGLAGTTWHMQRIEGDALFFFVRDVGIRFEEGGRFAAAVRFVDGQHKSIAGTYRAEKGGALLVTIPGTGKPKTLHLRRQGKDLIVSDRAYDVTARLAPGKMEEERWF